MKDLLTNEIRQRIKIQKTKTQTTSPKNLNLVSVLVHACIACIKLQLSRASFVIISDFLNDER